LKLGWLTLNLELLRKPEKMQPRTIEKIVDFEFVAYAPSILSLIEGAFTVI
jgi:hypothetical protein